MPVNAPLAEPEETFAKYLAQGMEPGLAYNQSRIGVARTCTVDQAQRLPGMWARVQWLKQNQEVVAPEEDPLEVEIIRAGANNVGDHQVMELLVKDHYAARKMGQMAAAIKAAELIGKQKGMFADNVNVKADVRHLIAVRLDDAVKRISPTITIPAIENK